MAHAVLAMNLNRLPACTVIACFVLLGGLIVMTIAWETLFTGRIYQCSDSAFPGMDFLFPGHWVHEPIAYVDSVDPTPPMSTHDALLKGWTVTKLWWAWWGMTAVVVITSLVPIAACLLRGKPPEHEGPQVR
jgi:hypothetical protein